MLRKYYLLGTLALLFLLGCTKLPINDDYYTRLPANNPQEEIKNHVIAIGKDGDLREPLTGASMDHHSQEIYLNNIVNKIKRYYENNNKAKIVIYIHGGLNSEGSALKRALKNYQAILNSGQYPVFINWNSDGLRSYGSHLGRIRQGEIRPIRAKLTSPLYLLTDIGDSLITAPKAWYVTGEHLIDSLSFKETIDDKLDTQIERYNDLIKITEGGGHSNLRRHLLWAATSPVKVVTTPFAYTLAKPAWDIMLRRTNTLFYTPCDLEKAFDRNENCTSETPSDEKTSEGVKFKSGNGALYRFLSALEQDLQNSGKISEVKITLIGHSMGAIIVNDIVSLGLNLTYENIVHMASADSIENLFNKVIPYINCSIKGMCNNPKKGKKNEVTFYSLYLHPDNENREVSGYGAIPSGSLLTWIDNMYTVPKTVLDKRSGRWDNMARAIDLIPPVPGETKRQNDIKGQMQFTIFNLEKKKKYCPTQLKKMKICKPEENCEPYTLYSTAQKHGDFDELPFWLPEVWRGTHETAKEDCD